MAKLRQRHRHARPSYGRHTLASHRPSDLQRRAGTTAQSLALMFTLPGTREVSMPLSRYFVVRTGDGEWMIRFEDEEYGPYRSQSEAMLFAIDAAQKLGKRGADAEVCLMGINGHFRPAWAYGRDAYPPR